MRNVHIRGRPYRNQMEDKQPFFQLLVEAQAQRRTVQLSYESLTEWETIKTTLRPYELLFDRRSWYVIGRSSTAQRSTHVQPQHRMQSAELLSETFRRPQGLHAAANTCGNAWRLVPESGPDSCDVRVRFQSLVARNVSEVIWHNTQECDSA